MSCTVFPKPQKSFSNTHKTCFHADVNGKSMGVQQSKKQYEPRLNVRPTDNHYFHFSQPNARIDLNQRHEHRADVGVFPRNLYAKHPFSKSMSYYIQPRDKQSHYTYSPKKHPRENEDKTIKRAEHVRYFKDTKGQVYKKDGYGHHEDGYVRIFKNENGDGFREGSYGHQEDGYITEKREHTPWHSVFGYDRFNNEYGVGSQSRGYIEPFDCHDCHQDVPPDMAPNRFYSEKHLKSSTSEFRDDIDEFSTPLCKQCIV